MGTCRDDAIVFSSGDNDFCRSDDPMPSDEESIKRKLVHRGTKNIKI
jgi:hypothetical protein